MNESIRILQARVKELGEIIASVTERRQKVRLQRSEFVRESKALDQFDKKLAVIEAELAGFVGAQDQIKADIVKLNG